MNALSLAERRGEAERRFRASGLPNRRVEEWKYSDLAGAIGNASLRDAGAASWAFDVLPEGAELIDLAAPGMPDWVACHLGALAGADAPGNASLAFATAGFALRVAAGVDAGEARVRISGHGNLRMLIVLEAGATLAFAEMHEAASLRNVGTEFFVAEGAALSHLRLSPHGDGVTTASIKARLGKHSRFEAHYADFGAKLSRADLHLTIAGEGTAVKLSGVTVLGGGHADVTTHVEHVAGNAASTQLFKYLAGGHARAVYQGRITVREGADGTDSRQTAKAILMGSRAEADLKPELFIYAEDVQCAHGAAVGDLDPEALFYLRARGLPEADARNMLIRAFLSEAVDEIARESWRETVWGAVEAALPAAMEALP